MRWDDVILAVIDALEDDDGLTDALGGERIYRAGASETPEIPSLEYAIISAVPRESTERVLVQFDIWATSFEIAVTIEARLHRVLHKQTFGGLGGIPMYALYQDSRDLLDPDPSVVHRSIDFLFEAVKARTYT